MPECWKLSAKALRQLCQLALLPLAKSAQEALMGGQAVIEGVMMRSPHSYAVAVRRPSGRIVVAQKMLDRPSEKYRCLRYPVLRGLGTLGQALTLGIRALHYSAQQAMDASPDAEPIGGSRGDPAVGGRPEMGSGLLALHLAFSIGFFLFLYKFFPLYLATLLQRHYAVAESPVIFNLVDGTIRIVLFLGFLVLLAQWKDIQRVFQYHGAEHKVVWAFETGDALDIDSARCASRFHPRCGTSFLLVVMVIAMVFYACLPFRSFASKFVGRVLLLPVIAGVSYEFVRFAARSRGRLWRWASQPGLWLQRITTREPDDSQLETAVRALEAAMELEKSRGGELVVA